MPATFPGINTVQSLSGGTNLAPGQGEQYTVTVVGSWASGDEATLTFTDALTGLQTQIGAGNVTGTTPTYVQTFDEKVYVLAGPTCYFSALNLPATFDDPNAAGDSFITLSNWFATPNPVLAMSPFQGGMLFLSANSSQLWNLAANPAQNAKQQTLPNIGTVAPQSVKSIGDMDVMTLAVNGFRSFRVRVASNNALIYDAGTPIDLIIQPLLAKLTAAQRAASCGEVEPNTNRYLCFIPDSSNANGVGYIYVRSFWPNAQVEAWSTYDPSYQVAVASPGANYGSNPATLAYTGLVVGKRYVWTPGANEVSLTYNGITVKPAGSFTVLAGITTATATGNANAASFTGLLTVTTYFTPVKFCVYNNQIWALGSADNQIYALGGSSGVTYENCGAFGITPYHSMDTPGTIKTFEAMDAAFLGTWTVGFSCDYTSQKFKNIYTNTVSSFQLGRMPVGMTGTHYALSFTEDGAGSALFSSFLVHVQPGNAK